MKFNQIIIVTGIMSLLLLQNVSANVKSDISSKRSQSKSRTNFINRVQNSIDRLQNTQNSQDQAKKLNHIHNINDYGPGKIRIDISKKDLHATIISREDDKNKPGSKLSFKEQKLSKIEMEAKANEINIEHDRKKLQQENDSIELSIG